MPMSPHLGVATGKALAPWCLLSSAMFSPATTRRCSHRLAIAPQSQRRVRVMACRRHGSRRALEPCAYRRLRPREGSRTGCPRAPWHLGPNGGHQKVSLSDRWPRKFRPEIMRLAHEQASPNGSSQGKRMNPGARHAALSRAIQALTDADAGAMHFVIECRNGGGFQGGEPGFDLRELALQIGDELQLRGGGRVV